MDGLQHLVTFVFQNFSFMKLFAFGCSVAMVIGGVVPFIPQYFDIRRNQNVDGFSTYVCFTLLVANTLRIMFWFGRHFELPLLLQSIIMNIAMMIMMHLCVSIKGRLTLATSKAKTFTGYVNCPFYLTIIVVPILDLWILVLQEFVNIMAKDFNTKHFWQWTDFLSYIECLATFTVIVGAVFYIFIDYSPVVELIGFLAVFAEALLGAPQLYRNHINRSTVGMSKKMVLMWTMGDTFKTVYFILRNAPVQFWICGSLQVSIDILILSQIVFYRTVSAVNAKPLSLSS